MSLDDFFNKKGKKKTKINTLKLFEQISDVTQPKFVETGKTPDVPTTTMVEENDWEPIFNEDVELDLSNVRINDLSVIKAEKEQAEAEQLEAVNKTKDLTVIWGGKSTIIPEEIEKKPEVEVSKKPSLPSVYVSPHLRAGGLGIQSTIKIQPNMESVEDFPTLGTVTEKPKKKPISEKQEVDNSWTEINKSSHGHRVENTSGAYVPPSIRQGSEFKTSKFSSNYKSSYTQSLEQRYQGIAPKDDSFKPPQTLSWSRGDIVKNPANSYTPSESNTWARGATSAGSTASKPYQIPQQKNNFTLSQGNRFFHLDSER